MLGVVLLPRCCVTVLLCICCGVRCAIVTAERSCAVVTVTKSTAVASCSLTMHGMAAMLCWRAQRHGSSRRQRLNVSDCCLAPFRRSLQVEGRGAVECTASKMDCALRDQRRCCWRIRAIAQARRWQELRVCPVYRDGDGPDRWLRSWVWAAAFVRKPNKSNWEARWISALWRAGRGEAAKAMRGSKWRQSHARRRGCTGGCTARTSESECWCASAAGVHLSRNHPCR